MSNTHIKTIILALVISLIAGIFPLATFAAPETETASDTPKITAESYIIMDKESGQILYGKNIDEQMYPASITKILTAILAIELSKDDLAQTVTVTKETLTGITQETSQIALDVGEVMSLEDLLYAALLPSANDACNAIAQMFGGENWQTEFPKMMTEKAKSIGAANSNFVNANGLHDDNHYTTAHDMALIMSYALNNETFRKIIATESRDIPATNKKKLRNYINTTVELIKPKSKYYYANALGGKTGYTPEAGNTCVSAAKKSGTTLICVVLKSKETNDRFTDSVNLFDYGFNNFTKVTMPSESLPRENIQISDDTNINGYASVFSESGVSFYLNKKNTLADITVTHDIPESFPSEDESKANITLALTQENDYMYNKIGTFPMTVVTNMLNNPTPLSAVSGTDKDKPENNTENGGADIIKIIIISLLIILLIALLVMVGFYLYSNMLRKKRARERRIERLKTRSLDPRDQENLDSVKENGFDEIKENKEDLTQTKVIKKIRDFSDDSEIYDEIFIPKTADDTKIAKSRPVQQKNNPERAAQRQPQRTSNNTQNNSQRSPNQSSVKRNTSKPSVRQQSGNETRRPNQQNNNRPKDK